MARSLEHARRSRRGERRRRQPRRRATSRFGDINPTYADTFTHLQRRAAVLAGRQQRRRPALLRARHRPARGGRAASAPSTPTSTARRPPPSSSSTPTAGSLGTFAVPVSRRTACRSSASPSPTPIVARVRIVYGNDAARPRRRRAVRRRGDGRLHLRRAAGRLTQPGDEDTRVEIGPRAPGTRARPPSMTRRGGPPRPRAGRGDHGTVPAVDGRWENTRCIFLAASSSVKPWPSRVAGPRSTHRSTVGRSTA